MLGDHGDRKVEGGGFMDESAFVDSSNFVISHVNYNSSINIQNSYSFLRAGPRRHLYFNTKKVRAAMVVCGEVHPGINAIIRELTMCLFYNY